MRRSTPAPSGRSRSSTRKGKLTARERVERLLDDGSFVELDELARHRSTNFGMEQNRPYGDGVVTGYGTIDGRQVCVFAQDFTVFGGSLGQVFGEKIVKVMDLAIKTGCPVIGINDSGGARIQEGVVSLGLYGEIFRRNVHASGVVPQISLIMGPCAGGAVYSPAVTDFTVMVDKTSHMFITGPDVIKTVTGEDVTMEELGGAHTHNSGAATPTTWPPTKMTRSTSSRRWLSYLPQNNLEDPPSYDTTVDLELSEGDRALDTLVPDSPTSRTTCTTVIESIVDDERFPRGPRALRAEHRRRFRPRRGPLRRRGREPADAARRARWTSTRQRRRARFVRTCDAFNIPVLTFVDVPGFLPGTTRSAAASSVTAPSCCSPTPKRPCRKSP